MSDAKHTPGPWAVGLQEEGGPWCVGAKDTAVIICKMAAAPGPHNEANAHLIAAAPDMLEALEGLIEAHNLGYPTIEAMNKAIDDAEKVAFAAIAKAKGEA